MTLDVSAVAPSSTASEPSLGGLDSDAFLKLLTAQMRFQDPLSPTDTSTMMQQTATFAQVERLQEIASVQQQMLTSQLASHASNLVGQQITAEQPDGTTVEGKVDAVRFTADGPVLSIGDDEVTLTAITRVSSAAEQSSTAST
ncbi:MAG TPA: flagellar hook capping FlgD N-terminal domain-containing protein [Euzebyales bacterium]|nr:flagellar hook capping FlgD N-terminal domain-containing protein [Euzebyales bacterium]